MWSRSQKIEHLTARELHSSTVQRYPQSRTRRPIPIILFLARRNTYPRSRRAPKWRSQVLAHAGHSDGQPHRTFRWTTLRVSMTPTSEQLALCARFHSEVVPADPTLKPGIALATLNLLPLNALRRQQENGTCGWYIYGGEYLTDDDFYQPLHVAHLAKYCPQFMPYLALAPGWRVLLAQGHEDVWFDERCLNERNI